MVLVISACLSAVGIITTAILVILYFTDKLTIDQIFAPAIISSIMCAVGGTVLRFSLGGYLLFEALLR